MRDAAPVVSRRRRTCLPSSIVGFFHGAFQPHLDQMQHAPINDPTRHRLEKFGVRNAPEVVREVGIDDVRAAAKQQPLHLDHRLLGISPRAVGILLWWKIGFEDRFQHQHRCRHADPIPQGRDAQRPEFAIGLRYVHSSDGVRSVSLLPERKRQFAKPPLYPVRFDVREVLTVHPRCPFVGAALSIGMGQDVFTADLVVQGIEAIAGFCLRFRVQRRLQFLNTLRS